MNGSSGCTGREMPPRPSRAGAIRPTGRSSCGMRRSFPMDWNPTRLTISMWSASERSSADAVPVGQHTAPPSNSIHHRTTAGVLRTTRRRYWKDRNTTPWPRRRAVRTGCCARICAERSGPSGAMRRGAARPPMRSDLNDHGCRIAPLGNTPGSPHSESGMTQRSIALVVYSSHC